MRQHPARVSHQLRIHMQSRILVSSLGLFCDGICDFHRNRNYGVSWLPIFPFIYRDAHVVKSEYKFRLQPNAVGFDLFNSRVEKCLEDCEMRMLLMWTRNLKKFRFMSDDEGIDPVLCDIRLEFVNEVVYNISPRDYIVLLGVWRDTVQDLRFGILINRKMPSSVFWRLMPILESFPHCFRLNLESFARLAFEIRSFQVCSASHQRKTSDARDGWGSWKPDSWQAAKPFCRACNVGWVEIQGLQEVW